LYEITNKRLIITGTCLDLNQIEYFDYIRTPDMPVVIALRISISIPILFTPYNYNNHVYVDGGLLDNYPMDQFKDELDDTLGFYIVNNGKIKIDCLENFFVAFLNSIVKSIYLKDIKFFEKQTIVIDTSHFEADFTIPFELKQKLFYCGYDQAKKFVLNYNLSQGS
jgi:NTE family protein